MATCTKHSMINIILVYYLTYVMGITLLDITMKVLEYTNGWIPQPLSYTVLRSTWFIPTTGFPADKYFHNLG